jgi:hypothetical protein
MHPPEYFCLNSTILYFPDNEVAIIEQLCEGRKTMEVEGTPDVSYKQAQERATV